MSGTPGATLSGAFYEADEGDRSKGWEQHSWTILDNPFIPHERKVAYLEEKRKTLTDGPYFREYEGRWFHDPDTLCFPYDPSRNRVWANDVATSLAGYDVRTVLAVDIGYSEPCSFSILKYVHGIPDIYVVRSYSQSGLTPSAAAATVMRLRSEYDNPRTVVDAGGMGKGYIEEWRLTHGVPCEAAKKSDKAGSIAEVAGLLKAGRLKVVASECGDLVDEWGSCMWNDAKTDVREGSIDHCSDGVRYGIRAIGGIRSNPELELSAIEKAAADERRERERALRENRARVRRMGG